MKPEIMNKFLVIYGAVYDFGKYEIIESICCGDDTEGILVTIKYRHE